VLAVLVGGAAERVGDMITWGAAARDLYDEDLTFVAIAARIGVSPGAVWNYAQRQKWPQRACDRERWAAKHPPPRENVRRFEPGEATLPPLASLE
jgi:hypothetical protein